MFIAKTYFETKFNKIFKKGDVVPAEIAEAYMSKVIEEAGELLVETPSAIEVVITEETAEVVNEEISEEKIGNEEKIGKAPKKNKKK